MNIRLFCVILLFSLLCGCTPKTKITADETVYVKWIMPGKGKFSDLQSVLNSANQLISSETKKIQVDFTIINKYEYFDKLNLYISAGQQVDIAWGNDEELPYIYKMNENYFKILDELLASDGTDVKKSLSSELTEKVKTSNRIYYLPTITASDGMIPFLKIPKALSGYMDINLLAQTVSESDAITEKHFSVINSYLNKLSAENELGNGADLHTLYNLFPLVGYETILSTSNLFGYKMTDSGYNIVNIQASREYALTQQFFKQWENAGYVREDIGLMNKKKLNAPNNYILSGVWGFFDDYGLHSIADDEFNNDFIYIPLDNKYHTSRLITDSVIFIPKNSKNSSEAMKVINVFYKNPKLYNLLTYGEEEKHYSVAENKLIRYIQKSPTYSMYPNILPNTRSEFADINYDNVVPMNYTRTQNKLENFKPIFSDINKVLYKYIISASDNFEPTVIKNADMQNILNELQSQADYFIKK